ncbi:hypothetical protein Ciccas_007769 [Cichlidogyrus casuarinus]|uniref:IMD domain-containing protein n=1 Tax=Cichlidogyrus casuarinus TaxID=1844966 RepID=A0ABD2Q248_9PLAT
MFVDAFQKVADIAYNSNCGLKDFATALTRLRLRQRDLELKLKDFNIDGRIFGQNRIYRILLTEEQPISYKSFETYFLRSTFWTKPRLFRSSALLLQRTSINVYQFFSSE